MKKQTIDDVYKFVEDHDDLEIDDLLELLYETFPEELVDRYSREMLSLIESDK